MIKLFKNYYISTANVPSNPCSLSPCGPNSQCRSNNGQAICSCVPGYLGNPPNCRPECIISSECPPNEICTNQKCRNPCIGSCGLGARCTVANRNPICHCPEGFTGDPFVRCLLLRKFAFFNYHTNILERFSFNILMNFVAPIPPEPINVCQPSPCGPNAQCQISENSPSCICLPDFIGSPPNCRPECISNSECPSYQACVNQKCKDPCIGSCGENAQCRTVSHTPMCYCETGYTGDPFTQCFIKPSKLSKFT